MHREGDDLEFGVPLQQKPGRRNAIHSRHFDVGEHHRGPGLIHQAKQFLTVPGLSHQLYRILFGQHERQAVPKDLMIVCDYQTYAIFHPDKIRSL